ncbi:MAG: universal stress protein [Gemmatimonadota bacterium]
MNVLLASDGSWHALQAARFLGRLLPQSGSIRIDLTTVLSTDPALDRGSFHRSLKEGKKWWAENEAWLEVAEAALHGPSVRVKRQTLTGGAAEALVRNSSAYDLVVAGVKGESAEEFVQLGIVARALLRHAESSVLLVRDRLADAGAAAFGDLGRPPLVILPSDGSARGLEAAWTQLDSLSIRCGAPEILMVRNAGCGVCQRAGETGADLIVLGASGTGPSGPAPLETVDREVAWRAPCSVLMLRRPEKAATTGTKDVAARRGTQKYVATESSSAA